MRFTYHLVFLCSFCYMALAHNPVPAPPPKWPAPQPPPQWPEPQPHPKHPPGPVSPRGTCPQPTEEQIRCLQQWACQHVIRLDLRCLLNLNGNPLLGGIGSGAGGGGGGGLLGGLLGK